MKAILGKKIGMSRIFTSEGDAVPVTLIFATPNLVAINRSKNKDGYDAVQLALPKEKHQIKPGEEQNNPKVKKSLRPLERKKFFERQREFRGEMSGGKQVVGISQFKVGDCVSVAAISKGKGFQGVVKRHGFKGGPASHGHRHVLRRPGSIGCRFPQHVRKGKRMAGRMGGKRVTVKNLSVMWMDESKNIIAVKGAVPGKHGSIVEIKGMAE